MGKLPEIDVFSLRYEYGHHAGFFCKFEVFFGIIDHDKLLRAIPHFLHNLNKWRSRFCLSLISYIFEGINIFIQKMMAYAKIFQKTASPISSPMSQNSVLHF